MTEVKHTPLPYTDAKDIAHMGEIYYTNNNGKKIILAQVWGEGKNTKFDNAAFIVRACNSHDELVEEMQRSVEIMRGMVSYRLGVQAAVDRMDAAIAKAKGAA